MILPDGGRAYLSKIFNDAWMTQYGFLERPADQTVGDVLRAKRDAGEIPPLVTVRDRTRRCATRSRCCTSTASRSCRSSARTTRDASSARSASAGCSRHAVADAALLDAEIVEVMEPPFPAVAATDPVREAVELLVGDRQALLVTEHGRRGRASSPAPTCWSRWPDERDERRAAARRALRDPRRPRRPEPDPHYGSVIPAIHQTSTYVQPRRGEFVEDYDYSRSANPTRSALERRSASSRAATPPRSPPAWRRATR